MVVRELELDLDAFEGPFDLLLTLVLKEELDLAEVDLASVVVAFVERLAARVSAMKVGPGTQAGVSIGPMINDEYADVTFALFALKAKGEPQRQLVRLVAHRPGARRRTLRERLRPPRSRLRSRLQPVRPAG